MSAPGPFIVPDLDVADVGPNALLDLVGQLGAARTDRAVEYFETMRAPA